MWRSKIVSWKCETWRNVEKLEKNDGFWWRQLALDIAITCYHMLSPLECLPCEAFTTGCSSWWWRTPRFGRSLIWPGSLTPWLSMTQCGSKVYIIPVPVFRCISMWVALEVGVVEWWFVRNDCDFFSITYVWRISRILYGMRKRRLKPRNPEQKEHKLWARVLRAVAAYFRQKMHFISPKGIVYILYEFGKHGIFPGSNHWCDSHRSLSWKRHCMKNYIYILCNICQSIWYHYFVSKNIFHNISYIYMILI